MLEGSLCYFNEGTSPVMYLLILSLLLVILNVFMHENDGLGTSTHIYEYPYVPLEFSRLAGITGHYTCQGFDGSCEHCQCKFEQQPEKSYRDLVHGMFCIYNLSGGTLCLH